MVYPMSKPKIVLVRSPQQLLENNLAGYGWGQVNFSEFNSAEDIYRYLEHEKRVNLGRQKNQIKRFFKITKGDLVVIPVHRAIVLGVATGEKSFQPGINYGENQVRVSYFRDLGGKIVRIPRSKLSQGLESRLKIRMSIAQLDDFEEEILGYQKQLKDSGSVCFDSIFQQKLDDAEETVKAGLLANLRNGQTGLESGGYGLEKLIKELLEIEGYAAHIEAKNQSSGIADIDITATRNDPISSNRVFIQAKHHYGTTSRHGIKQLIAIEEEEHHDKWLITTGDVSEDDKEFAQGNNVKIMEGNELVEWIYKRISRLSDYTKEALRISVVPQIL